MQNFIITDRMKEINSILIPLEFKFDNLRGKYRKPFDNEMRELCIEIEKLEAEYWDISRKVNPEYHAMKPIYKKRNF